MSALPSFSSSPSSSSSSSSSSSMKERFSGKGVDTKLLVGLNGIRKTSASSAGVPGVTAAELSPMMVVGMVSSSSSRLTGISLKGGVGRAGSDNSVMAKAGRSLPFAPAEERRRCSSEPVEEEDEAMLG